MDLHGITKDIANYLKYFDSTKPVHKAFRPGIGPFGEPQLIRELASGLNANGYSCRTRRTPDLEIGDREWALEFKIVRPFGDNGREAENWSVNLLHPYEGNTSALGDALKLKALPDYSGRAVFVIGYEHQPPKIRLEPLVQAFELVAVSVLGIELGPRVEEIRSGLVHPEHQVLRCIAWKIV